MVFASQPDRFVVSRSTMERLNHLLEVKEPKKVTATQKSKLWQKEAWKNGKKFRLQ